MAQPGIGQDWAYGYTPTLKRFTADLALSKFDIEDLIGREKELEVLQRTLSKDQNPNAILVGQPGVGKKTLAVGLSKLISFGKSMEFLLYKKVLLLDLDLLLAKTQAETQQNLIIALEEAKRAGNIILVIPSFEQFVSNDTGHINLTEVLSQHLTNNSIQIIGITDPFSYQKYILPNKIISNLFEKVEVDEVSKENALIIAQNKSLELESKYKISSSYEALEEIVKQTQDLITDVPFPQKAIDTLNETYVFGKNNKKKIITAADIDEILSQKTELPLGKLKTEEKEILSNLEEFLHKRVIGQDNAINKVAQALRRKRTGVEIKDSAIGTFLFLGPSGVGKTETAKALAQAYFGDENKMIRIDMSEFENEESIEKLIGGNENPGILTSSVRENPFCVLLLDEFEKANPKILNLFLTVFDEGYLKDTKGQSVSFKNTIIIATSNAGSEFIREHLENNSLSDLDKNLTEYLLSNKMFSPELINRFDGVIFYKPLTRGELGKIAVLILDRLNKKLQKDQEISINVNQQTIMKLVEKGYDPQFGARNLQRTIQEEVENKVASKILDGSAKKGSEVLIEL